jgi:hypothetical protein
MCAARRPAVPAAGGAASRRLGVNAAAGWFKTLFPLLGGGLKDGKKIQFMPRNVIDAVQKAIKEATVDLAVDVSRGGGHGTLLKGAGRTLRTEGVRWGGLRVSHGHCHAGHWHCVEPF